MPILFDEILLSPNVISSWGAGSPTYANTMIRNPATGVFKTNVNRFDPTEEWTINLELMTAADRAYLVNFWRGGYGSGVGFRVRIPADYTASLEAFGTGNGVTTVFPLYTTYTRPGVTARQDVRRILKPVMDTVARLTNLGGAGGSVRLYEPDGITPRVISVPFKIFLNGVETTAYTINNTTGLVTMTSAPANGVILSWSGEFDTPMAFTQNAFQQSFDVHSSVQGLGLREILYPELGL